MQEKLQTRAFEIVAPALQPGEEPVMATRAMVGKFSSGRLGTVVKQGLVLDGIGSVGAAIAAANSKQFVVVTNRRLIFLPQTFLGGPGKKIIGEVPREQATLAEVKKGIVTLIRIAFGDQGDGVALTFPRQDKKNAEALAAALGGAPVA
jgi:hypothetical protein